jgi:hypothetical protein
METNFDLDVTNYTTDDLIKFFKLEKTYNLVDLKTKEEELSTEILYTSNDIYNPKYKLDIIQFIKLAKDVLTSSYYDIEAENEMNKNINRYFNKGKDPRVGKIINPLSPHQALERQIVPPESVNGYNNDSITTVYMFNTATRNDYFNTVSSNSTFYLPLRWKDVISISLSSANIPNVMYAFNEEAQTNKIYIEEDGTGLSGIVTLPEGNYNPYAIDPSTPFLNDLVGASFPDILTKVINEQILGITDPGLYRFFVDISLASRKTTIRNTTYSFTMNTVKHQESRCTPYSTVFLDERYDNYIDKKDIPRAKYFQTLGFLMGYTNIYYEGSNSYTSESIFNNKYSDYLYFAMDDFTGSQTISNTIGILDDSGMIDGNILGIIPINSALFTTTFDDNANFIYKKREYFGPVDIARINIRLLNQKGNLVNLHESDFSFSLQVKTIYNLSQNSKFNLRTNTPF